MSIRGISLDCDTPGCWAYCQLTAPTLEAAVRAAVDRRDWSVRDGKHFCGPCTRPGDAVAAPALSQRITELNQLDDDYTRTALPILLTYSQQVLDGVDLPKLRRSAFRAGDTQQLALIDALIAARAAYVNYEKRGGS